MRAAHTRKTKLTAGAMTEVIHAFFRPLGELQVSQKREGAYYKVVNRLQNYDFLLRKTNFS